MNSANAAYVILAWLVFGVAMLSFLIQWLESEELARHALPGPGAGAMIPETSVNVVSPAAKPANDVTLDAKPALIGDDETAIARLCFTWGSVGTLLGLASGAVAFGAVGAMLGGVIFSTFAIGATVLEVVVRDRRTMKAWRTAH